MADIAIKYNRFGELDICIQNGEPAADAGFDSYVLISLFSDRRALPDDDRPDDGRDPRGWWADALPGANPLGSRLWLLSRAKTTAETLRRAEDYSVEALQWLVNAGAASDVQATARREGEALLIDLVITEAIGNRRAYRLNWTAQKLQKAAG